MLRFSAFALSDVEIGKQANELSVDVATHPCSVSKGLIASNDAILISQKHAFAILDGQRHALPNPTPLHLFRLGGESNHHRRTFLCDVSRCETLHVDRILLWVLVQGEDVQKKDC